MATKKVNIDIIARDKSKRALNKVRANLDGVKRSVFNLRNAFIGLGVGLAVRSLINTGKSIENLQVRLKFLFGTAEEGAKAFDEMAKFAAKVPFSLEEIQKGAGVLAVVSKDAKELAKNMELTGNVAAVTGLDFKTTAEQIQRSLSAGISAADLFRDRGVKSMLGFKAGATVSVEETAEAFERVFGAGGKFAGATDALAQTFEGTLSMIGDKIFNFKRSILEAGFFPELKKQFGDLNKFLEANGKTLDEIAESIGKGLASAVKISANAILFLRDNFNFLVESIKLLIAFKIAGIFVALASGIMGANRAMLLFNATVKRNLFIAGAAIVISQFDKILDVLGRLPTSFDSFGEAIAENKRQYEHYNKQLGMAKAHLDDLEKKYGSSIVPKHIKDIANAKSIYDETNETLKKLKEESDALFKEAYPVYEDRILKLVKAKKQENKVTKELVNNYDFLTRNLGDARSEWQKASTSIGLNTSMLSHNKEEAINTFTAHHNLVEKLEQVPPILQEVFVKWNSIRDIMKDVQVEVANTDTLFGSFKEGFSEAMNVDIFEKFKEVGKNTFDSLTKMLSDFVMTGKMNFQDFAKTVTRMIVEALIGQAIQYAITQSLEMWKMSTIREAMMDVYGAAVKAFKNFGGWPFGAMAAAATIATGMALVNKIKGFEQGGRPPVGQPSMVGERGPELFIPDRSGTIVPNNQLGGKAVTVNFNINTVDARGFNELLVNSRGVIVNMINSAVNEKGRMAIV